MNSSLSLSLTRSMIPVAAALLAALAPVSPSLAQPAAGFAVRVNGEVQPAERGQVLLQEQIARGAANTSQLQSVLRETLINQAVMAQAAVKAGLDQQPQVRARVDLSRQNALAQAWQQKVLENFHPSDADMQAEYQHQVQNLGTQEVRLRHVLVADEKQAQEVYAQLKDGAPFAQVVTRFSIDATTRESGGLSNWVPLGRLAPGLVNALQGLEKGQLAPAPVLTAAGWQVLRLEDQRPYTPPELVKVKRQLSQALAKQRLEAELKTLRESAKVE